MRNKKIIIVIAAIIIILLAIILLKSCNTKPISKDSSTNVEIVPTVKQDLTKETETSEADTKESASETQDTINLESVSEIEGQEIAFSGQVQKSPDSEDDKTLGISDDKNAESSSSYAFGNYSGSLSDKGGYESEPENTDEEETERESEPETVDPGDESYDTFANNNKLTYEYYINEMTPEEKKALFDSAPSPQAFLRWVAEIRAEYENERDKHITNVEDGISLH